MSVIKPNNEGAALIADMGGKSLQQCCQCGLCTAVCPWSLVKKFSPRHLIKEAQYGLFDVESWWTCTTCAQCTLSCPRGVETIDIVKAVRHAMCEGYLMPGNLQNIRTSLRLEGNPWQETREKRKDWAGLEAKEFVEDMEWLYFVCCTLAYDPAEKRVAQATASILKKLGIRFGILGVSENCCGESIRKAGDEKLFRELAQENIKTFNQKGARKILVNSPHCYSSFKDEYREFSGNYEVFHFVQFFAGLLKERGLTINKSLNKKVVYHDPCYLGRHNNIYDEPRDILQAIPGIELVEFPKNRDYSICCGGGGGGLWSGSKSGESLSDLRVLQAIELEADVLAVACPYCMINFEDSITTLGLQNSIQVLDICSIVNEVI
jgi:Fe-S oxidoreductase